MANKTRHNIRQEKTRFSTEQLMNRFGHNLNAPLFFLPVSCMLNNIIQGGGYL